MCVNSRIERFPSHLQRAFPLKYSQNIVVATWLLAAVKATELYLELCGQELFKMVPNLINTAQNLTLFSAECRLSIRRGIKAASETVGQKQVHPGNKLHIK